MSPRNILLTGASGYLGGTILAQLDTANLPHHGRIFALIRSDKQADSVKQYGVTALTFDPFDRASVEDTILRNQISVVYWLVDPLTSVAQRLFIQALSRLNQETGRTVHFLHTSGAKMFSELSGAPTDLPLLDNDPSLNTIQKHQQAPYPVLQQAVGVNNEVIELAEAQGVRSYIFVPCNVYGKGQGFGNPVSIQTTAIVKAAKAAKRVYRVDTDHPAWPVSHVDDTVALYIEILRKILAEEDIGYGRNGYYMAASGSVAWDDFYDAVAKSLANRGVIDDPIVALADDAALGIIADALACPKELVRVQLGGNCTLTARHGESLGWEPKYAADHLLASTEAEVELILQNL